MSIDPDPLRRPPRYPIATGVLIAINVGVWLLQVATGTSPGQASPAALVAWGGDLPLYTLTGDTWRLLTAMFLHAGIVHLGLNMYVLAFTAPRVEYEFGTGRMLAIYFAGGLLASCSSVFSGAMKLSSAGLLTVSVGASGAVMALFGSLLTGLLLTPPRFAHLPRSQQPSLGRGLVQVVVINIGMGFVIQGVDNAAHVGGLIGGAVVGAIMAVAPGARGAGAMLARLLATTALVVACTGALLHGVDRPALLEMRAQVDADR